MIENSIFVRNRAGKKARTLGMTYPALEAVELAHRAGFDAIHLDGEHGAFSPPEIDKIVGTAHLCGMSVTARVQNIASDHINMWLDRGIQGIMAPHIETGEQAQALVNACFFAPKGGRSWGTHRGTEFNDDEALDLQYGGRREFTEFANDNMLVYCQVESILGYENLDDILSVDGLHAITFGHFDLALSMNMPGEGIGNPEVDRIQADMTVRARAAGKRVASDFTVSMGLLDTIVSAGRRFTSSHEDDNFPPQN
jgi:4-hydroxy-2-oxoheptanedioate aldolase